MASLTIMIACPSGPGIPAPCVVMATRGLKGYRHFGPGREPP